VPMLSYHSPPPQCRAIGNPFMHLTPAGAIYLGVMGSLPVLSVDILLFCRVIAVFPPSRTPLRVMLAVYSLPGILKISRIGILVGYGVQTMWDIRHGRANLRSLDTTSKEIKIYAAYWYLTALDNA
jgi:hypothetical protein